MKRAISALLILLGLIFLTGARKEKPSNEPVLDKLGRAVIVVNDKASLLVNRQDDMWSTTTHDMPVVFDQTMSAMVTPVASVVWKDLRADQKASDQLAADCADYKLSDAIKDQVSKPLVGANVTIVADSLIQAAINRARIAHPVKFADDSTRSMLPLDFKSVISGSSNHYHDWEQSLLQDLDKDDRADSLIVVNVFLWGLRPGGSKVEDKTGEEKQERYLKTRNIVNAFSKRTAQTLLFSNVRVLSIKTGELLRDEEMTYSISDRDLTTEMLMADSSLRFKRQTSCLLEWYAENLKLQLAGDQPLEDWECKEGP